MPFEAKNVTQRKFQCVFLLHRCSVVTNEIEATILGYVSHVKSAWATNGGTLPDYDVKTVNELLWGVRRLRPQNPDTPAASLLFNEYKTIRLALYFVVVPC